MSQTSQPATENPFLVGAAMLGDESADDEGTPNEDRIPRELRERIRATTRASVISLRGSGTPPSEVAEGVEACLILPWYERERLSSHLVLFAGRGTGTMEVWVPEQSDASRAPELRLASGYFGELREFFRLTAATRFRWDEGLPGQSAFQHNCVVLGDLAESSAFLRAAAAQSVGLSCGFAFPVFHPHGMDIVTVLLGTRDREARRIDTWAARSNVVHLGSFSPGNTSNEQLELATKLAIGTSRAGTPALLRREGSASPGRSGFSWIAGGNTSIPRILTVVT